MPQLFFGEFHAEQKRGIKQDVGVCAISGEKTRPGDELWRIPGTKYFVRIKAGLGAQLSEEAREGLATNVKKAAAEAEKAASKSKPEAPAPKEG